MLSAQRSSNWLQVPLLEINVGADSENSRPTVLPPWRQVHLIIDDIDKGSDNRRLTVLPTGCRCTW